MLIEAELELCDWMMLIEADDAVTHMNTHCRHEPNVALTPASPASALSHPHRHAQRVCVRLRLHSIACVCLHLHSIVCVCLRLHSIACVCLRLHSIVCVCLRLHSIACVCLRLHSIVCVCLQLHSTAVEEIDEATQQRPKVTSRNPQRAEGTLSSLQLRINTQRSGDELQPAQRVMQRGIPAQEPRAITPPPPPNGTARSHRTPQTPQTPLPFPLFTL
ncbi:hypothetical protein JZ751_019933 [Albula glossodonta]|uniref:Uncharacterized protein n=1 Tax=Albula glossodonta TaxID=121402 RepID=A0A8T2MU37_9TELE|nr:hypothetical protein JZ751_019933 [Albula glossodonta]